ncbi:MAG TPA: Crp/Fnr family transcriptional regulator [Methyloceanibacter sp.]|nr:Crp/Fnr family transcriptional regulator [Methyloceanibacter sp.]
MNETLPDQVAASALMRGTGDEALKLIRRARLQLRPLAAGEWIFRPGDPADAIYLLLGAHGSGEGLHIDPLVQVELKPLSGKRSLRFERIVHGEVFGELELLEQGLSSKPAKRTTSAFALTPSSVVSLPLPLVGALMDADSLFRARLIRIGSQRLLAALKQQHDKAHAFPDLLLADWFVELSADIGIAEANRVRFPRKIAQEHIAADLGVSRETISRRLNEWERSGLLRTGARSQQIEILDYQRISRLASLRSARSRAALERTIDDIDAAIASGDLVRARNIGLDILRYYPSSPELHHRTALAAARSGDAKGALELLARSGLPMAGDTGALEDAVRKARRNPFLPMERILSEAFVDDGYGEDELLSARDSNGGADAKREAQLVEDLAALQARLLKEQAFDAERSAERRKRAAASFEAYHRLFLHKQGYYPGVNAATMALIAGDRETAAKVASTLAKTLSPEAEEYWPLATLAEALLILGKQAAAEAMLKKAAKAKDADAGAKASTILQFRRLKEFVDADIEALVRALDQHSVAVITGHIFRGKELGRAAQEEAEALIRADASDLLKEHHVGIVYGALAAGADIILAETALSLGAEFVAVLPFATERFIETSVKIGDPPAEPGKWEKRFRAILEGNHGSCSLTVMDSSEPPERERDSYFFYAFRYAAGLALQRAAVLQTSCRLIAVSDAGGPDSLGGSNRALADWSAHGRAFDLVAYPHERARRAFRDDHIDGFRAAVFLWDAAPGGSDTGNALDTIGESCAMGVKPIERTHRDGRRGLCLIAGSTEEALDAGRAAAKAAGKVKAAVRVICDFGLVLGANRTPDKKLIARLQAADDLAGLPPNCVLATESYAAQAKFDLGEKVVLVPVSRAEAMGEDGAQAARSRPSLPIYTAEWVKGVAKI